MQKIKNIIVNAGWFVVLGMLIANFHGRSTTCVMQSWELNEVKRQINSHGFIKMENADQFIKALQRIKQNYPNMNDEGWVMVMPAENKEKIEVYFPMRLSATVTFTFNNDGSYKVEAIK